MHVIADQEISKHFARKFKYFFRYYEIISTRDYSIFLGFVDTSHPQLIISNYDHLYVIHREGTSKIHEKNPSPRTFKQSPKTRLNEYKWLFNCNFLALMIHSYTCDNAQITGWRIILSWLMRLNFQKNWISSSLYPHIKMLWQYIYAFITYRNVLQYIVFQTIVWKEICISNTFVQLNHKKFSRNLQANRIKKKKLHEK